MRFNIVSVVLIGGGSVCLYAAIKNLNPIDVVKNALQGKSPAGTAPRFSTPRGDSTTNRPPGFIGPVQENRPPGFIGPVLPGPFPR